MRRKNTVCRKCTTHEAAQRGVKAPRCAHCCICECSYGCDGLTVGCFFFAFFFFLCIAFAVSLTALPFLTTGAEVELGSADGAPFFTMGAACCDACSFSGGGGALPFLTTGACAARLSVSETASSGMYFI